MPHGHVAAVALALLLPNFASAVAILPGVAPRSYEPEETLKLYARGRAESKPLRREAGWHS